MDYVAIVGSLYCGHTVDTMDMTTQELNPLIKDNSTFFFSYSSFVYPKTFQLLSQFVIREYLVSFILTITLIAASQLIRIYCCIAFNNALFFNK